MYPSNTPNISFDDMTEKEIIAEIKLFFKTRAKPKRKTPSLLPILTDAVKYKKYKVVQYILDDTEIDPTKLNNYALDMAAGNKKMEDLLLADKRIFDYAIEYLDFASSDILSAVKRYKMKKLGRFAKLMRY